MSVERPVHGTLCSQSINELVLVGPHIKFVALADPASSSGHHRDFSFQHHVLR